MGWFDTTGFYFLTVLKSEIQVLAVQAPSEGSEGESVPGSLLASGDNGQLLLATVPLQSLSSSSPAILLSVFLSPSSSYKDKRPVQTHMTSS